MGRPRNLDPSASARDFFGSELRRLRTESGLSQERLGEILSYSGSMIGQVEVATRTPTKEFAMRCDAVLETGGTLSRLWPLVNHQAFPDWFRDFVELEARATAIRKFEVQVVPGLLQTEDYARTVLRGSISTDSDESVEVHVQARLSRQTILTQANPPHLWLILDEGVLRRPMGGRDVMRTQLSRLLDAADSPQIIVQVLPYNAGAHPGLNGAMTILSMNEGPDVLYSESLGNGQLLDRLEDVARYAHAYDLLRALALPPAESSMMIRSAMEDA